MSDDPVVWSRKVTKLMKEEFGEVTRITASEIRARELMLYVVPPHVYVGVIKIIRDQASLFDGSRTTTQHSHIGLI